MAETAKKQSASKPRKRAAKKTAAHRKSTKPTVLVEGSGKNAQVFLETQKG